MSDGNAIDMGLLRMFGLQSAPAMHVNEQLQAITRRSERLSPQEQARTFVALGGIEGALLNADNRIMFGRRGTGKTHILSFVAETARKRGDIAIQIDLRSIGSNSYLYADEGIGVADRATRLLRDFVSHLHDQLLDQLTLPKSGHNLNRLADSVDRIGESVKEIVVRDVVETRRSSQGNAEASIEVEGKGKISAFLASGEIGTKGVAKRNGGTADEVKESKWCIRQVEATFPSVRRL